MPAAKRFTSNALGAVRSFQVRQSAGISLGRERGMELTVLSVPGCPNAPELERRLAVVLAGQPAVTVTRLVISDMAEAARWGMHGSPTLLVDGQDRFAEPGAATAVACRLYRGEDGRLEGAPTVAALGRVLGQPGAPQ
jgi:hypothetical protein